MTNNERRAKLRSAFDRWNWSMRIESRGDHERILVVGMDQRPIGLVLLNEGGGFYRNPESPHQAVRDLFYKLVDEALSES